MLTEEEEHSSQTLTQFRTSSYKCPPHRPHHTTLKEPISPWILWSEEVRVEVCTLLKDALEPERNLSVAQLRAINEGERRLSSWKQTSYRSDGQRWLPLKVSHSVVTTHMYQGIQPTERKEEWWKCWHKISLTRYFLTNWDHFMAYPKSTKVTTYWGPSSQPSDPTHTNSPSS